MAINHIILAPGIARVNEIFSRVYINYNISAVKNNSDPAKGSSMDIDSALSLANINQQCYKIRVESPKS